MDARHRPMLRMLPANAALVTGTKAFVLTNRTAGIWTDTASNVTHTSISSDTSTPYTVNAGAIAKLQVLAPGETAVPGSASGKSTCKSCRV